MKYKKLIIFGILAVLIFLGNAVFGWSDLLGNVNNLQFLNDMVQNNLAAALGIYIVLTVIGCVVLALPGITFAVLAGVLFGPWVGTAACSVASTAGAMAAFLAGRFFLKDSIKPLVQKNKYLNKLLFSGEQKNEVLLLMITRLVPVFPYNLQNFAYGITDMKFGMYSLLSFLFMVPGTAMYTVGAAGITDGENRMLYLAIAGGLAAVVLGTGFFMKKKYVGLERAEEENEK